MDAGDKVKMKELIDKLKEGGDVSREEALKISRLLFKDPHPTHLVEWYRLVENKIPEKGNYLYSIPLDRSFLNHASFLLKHVIDAIFIKLPPKATICSIEYMNEKGIFGMNFDYAGELVSTEAPETGKMVPVLRESAKRLTFLYDSKIFTPRIRDISIMLMAKYMKAPLVYIRNFDRLNGRFSDSWNMFPEDAEKIKLLEKIKTDELIKLYVDADLWVSVPSQTEEGRLRKIGETMINMCTAKQNEEMKEKELDNEEWLVADR